MTEMTKRQAYCEILRDLQDWETFLLTESGLPGPRANLELAQAAADLGDAFRFEAWLRFGPELADTNSAQVFLAVCGAIGLGRLLAEGELARLTELRQLANDPRWRMREAVCMALQRWGMVDMPAMLAAVEDWVRKGTLLEKRAAAAAVCEPVLLKDTAIVLRVLALLDEITAGLISESDRRSAAFKTLRQGLAYCWSVAVAAYPEIGKPLMEKWLACEDRDVRWVMKENLGKARLERMDAAWVAQCRENHF
jgi:hypothetical protein